MTTHILIADDHPLFRDAIRSALEHHVNGGSGTNQMYEAGDFDEAMKLLDENREMDLLLLDLGMPGSSGLSALVSVRATHPSLPVIIVSGTDDPATVRRSIELGAAGFISKQAGTDRIRDSVNTVLQGGTAVPAEMDLGSEQDEEIRDLIERIRTLTPQQARVLGMLAQGLLNKQIAYELSVSEATIKAHVSAVLQKLNVDSRTQAVIRLSRIGSDILENNEDRSSSATH